MSDVIRQAVELADGWSPHGGWGATVLQGKSNQKSLDALAAQLVRQVDALNHIFFASYQGDAFVYRIADNGETVKFTEESTPDRTMNTIKVIVDSNVLAGSS